MKKSLAYRPIKPLLANRYSLIKELKYITMDREKRYAGESKMSFLKPVQGARI